MGACKIASLSSPRLRTLSPSLPHQLTLSYRLCFFRVKWINPDGTLTMLPPENPGEIFARKVPRTLHWDCHGCDGLVHCIPQAD